MRTYFVMIFIVLSMQSPLKSQQFCTNIMCASVDELEHQTCSFVINLPVSNCSLQVCGIMCVMYELSHCRIAFIKPSTDPGD